MAKRPDITTVQVRKSHLSKLDRIAKKYGVNRSVVFRWAVDEYVTRFAANGSNDSTIQPVEPDGKAA